MLKQLLSLDGWLRLTETVPSQLMTTAPLSSVTDSDRSLLERVARGDEAALGALYDRYAAALYALGHRIAGERADAEEIVLETFAQAWREAGRFSADRGSVAAWITMICRSRALDLVRARGRRARLAESAQSAAGGGAEGTPGMAVGATNPAGAVEQKERARWVVQALASLPPPQREAIELAYYEGLSHSEIAERLQQPLGTIKTRVRLALQRLRDALRPYFFEAAP